MSEYTERQLDEIDAMVAEHVFNWSWWERRCDDERWRKALYPPENDPSGFERMNFCPAFRPASKDTLRFSDWNHAVIRRSDIPNRSELGVPHYTLCGSAMLEVMERMRSMSPSWLASIVLRCGDREPYDKIRYAVDFRRVDGERGMKYACGLADTAPLAVALAALQAVGHPYGEQGHG